MEQKTVFAMYALIGVWKSNITPTHIYTRDRPNPESVYFYTTFTVNNKASKFNYRETRNSQDTLQVDNPTSSTGLLTGSWINATRYRTHSYFIILGCKHDRPAKINMTQIHDELIQTGFINPSSLHDWNLLGCLRYPIIETDKSLYDMTQYFELASEDGNCVLRFYFNYGSPLLVSFTCNNSPSDTIHVKLLSQYANGARNYVVVFPKDAPVMSGILKFAYDYKVKSAHFSGIGALNQATIAWYDPSQKKYRLNQVRQQVELISLLGNITLLNNRPTVHTHVALGLQSGEVRGGHLMEGITNPTIEMFVTVEPTPLFKEYDPQTGLNLMLFKK